MGIDGRIDLHGLTQDKAFAALEQFLARHIQSGARCLLVITGKGRDADSGTHKGVLKQLVPEWISCGRFHPFILSVSPAKPKDGGSGAFYVLLRRNRITK